VFGPGRGECVVIKTPGGPWLIVDSFVVGSRPNYVPVSVEYFRQLGVSDVFGFVVTHWHEDHTRGAAEVVQEYAASLQYVALPSAVNQRELASLLVDLLPDDRRFALVRDLAAVMSRLGDANLGHIQRILLTGGVHLPTAGSTQFVALSPSFEDLRHQAATLLSYLPGWQGPQPRHYDVNSGCAVLRLSSGPFAVLLYSDLDVGMSDQHGIRCIVRNYSPQLRADIIKVGHHGSETAYHPPALQAGQANLAAGAITPFPARGEPLPRRKKLLKYKQALRTLHVTAAPGISGTKAGKVPINDTPFAAYVKVVSRHLDGVGQIRYRMREGEAVPRIELFGRAIAA
jgi:hypothetical protein